MKRIILFVILKFVEISGSIFVFYFLSLYGYWIDSLIADSDKLISHNVGGFFLSIIAGVTMGIMVPIIALVFLAGIICGIYQLILKNWEWSGRL